MSKSFQDHLIPITTGVSIPHISEQQILSFQIPMMSLAEQTSAVSVLAGSEERHALIHASLSKQISLLQERRQAIITAAVTGQLDLVGAR